MDAKTILAVLDFNRSRLIASLDTIAKSGQDAQKVLQWRPAPGRAHIGWQALHCAATHDKYFHVIIKGQPAPVDAALVTCFGGGSTPADRCPPLAETRATLDRTFAPFRDYVSGRSAADLDTIVGPPDRQRKLGEALILLAFHEAHHQGQIHLTWNLYKQAHGLTNP
jgi:hypothetical protein